MATVIATHGGCGYSLKRDNLDKSREADTRATLNESLVAGFKVLEDGGSAIDAVVASVVILEDSPIFNAGCGSVQSCDGSIEMDAGIMDGHMHAVGACSNVQSIKNPILLARGIMDQSEHSVLCAQGAETFATTLGLDTRPKDYFVTEYRRQQLEQFLKKRGAKAELASADIYTNESSPKEQQEHGFLRDGEGIGTVGAVALDLQGRFASCSSTGGMTGKLPGRVSDSSVPGAGFYATQNSAVTATGNGDAIMAAAACSRIICLHQDKGLSLETALAQVMDQDLSHVGVGFIAIDKNAKVYAPFNTSMMPRGFLSHGQEQSAIAIFADEIMN